MTTVTVTLNAGIFSYENEAIKVNGNLNVNGKDINNINGQVLDGDINIGSFDAYRNGDSLSYNLHFTDPTVASTLVEAVYQAVLAVEGKL